jgi:hypothetical protein
MYVEPSAKTQNCNVKIISLYCRKVSLGHVSWYKNLVTPSFFYATYFWFHAGHPNYFNYIGIRPKQITVNRCCRPTEYFVPIWIRIIVAFLHSVCIFLIMSYSIASAYLQCICIRSCSHGAIKEARSLAFLFPLGRPIWAEDQQGSLKASENKLTGKLLVLWRWLQQTNCWDVDSRD